MSFEDASNVHGRGFLCPRKRLSMSSEEASNVLGEGFQCPRMRLSMSSEVALMASEEALNDFE